LLECKEKTKKKQTKQQLEKLETLFIKTMVAETKKKQIDKIQKRKRS